MAPRAKAQAKKATPAKRRSTATKKANNGKAAPKKQEPTGSWFSEGSDGFEQKHQLDALGEMRKTRSIQRFFLKAGEEGTIIFVDDGGLVNSPCMV